MLNPREKFPELELPLVGGGTFSINALDADQYTILVFYRGLHCPVCKKYNKELESQYQEFKKKGVDVVAISCDSRERAEKSQKEWGLDQLPVAYDLSIQQADELGLYISRSISEKEPDFFSEPGMFILDNEQNIYAAYYQSMPFARPPVDDLLKGLDYIIEKDYPPRGLGAPHLASDLY
jgi:peroxiredoxin